ncbi:uncharacterized protein LOC127838377 isoform X1 [Dreissena polymorpha]|uniref:uncharacterized protein LOC127838377 isoform X1 n=1 Tax=Dreissena polymorpha TaxID=45954 RepID=UPI0022641B75|nr:uncharacterized protein LOC127838377 isoform X1 [Dreissena polymorpha]
MASYQTLAQTVRIVTAVFFMFILHSSISVLAYRRHPFLEFDDASLSGTTDQRDVKASKGSYNIHSAQENVVLPPSKRYASLSYYYGNRGNSRGSSRNYNRYYRSRYYQNYHKPWLNLGDRECFRDKCLTNDDCCRRYSKCDKDAHVCYSCWYGHPCSQSRDCCEQYSYCNKNLGICQS